MTHGVAPLLLVVPLVSRSRCLIRGGLLHAGMTLPGTYALVRSPSLVHFFVCFCFHFLRIPLTPCFLCFFFAAGSPPSAVRAAPPSPRFAVAVAACPARSSSLRCRFPVAGVAAALAVPLPAAALGTLLLAPAPRCAVAAAIGACAVFASTASLLARSALLRSSLSFAAATAAACAVGSTSLFLARNRPSASVVLAMMGPPWCGVRGPTPRGPT